MRFGHLIAATAAVCTVTSVCASEALAATCVVRKFDVVRVPKPYQTSVNKITVDFDLTSGGGQGVVDGTVYYKMPPQTWWSYLTGPVGGEPGVGANQTINVTDTLTDLPRNCPYKLNIWFNGQWVNNPGNQASP
jgi:hypothetical protein